MLDIFNRRSLPITNITGHTPGKYTGESYPVQGNSLATDSTPADWRVCIHASGSKDLWGMIRETPNDPWGDPVNLGPIVNTSEQDVCPVISADGLSLFFMSNRPGGVGTLDLWQVSNRANC